MDRIALERSLQLRSSIVEPAFLGKLRSARAASLGMLAALFCLTAEARAGAVLISPPPMDPASTGDGYPESRFGYGPARIESGIGPSYTAKAVREMDEEELDFPRNSESPTRRASRRPAGLEFSAETSQSPSGSAASRENDFTPRLNRRAPELDPVGKSIGNPMVRKGVQEVAVIAGDLGFFPKTVFVVRDLPVRMYVTGSSKNTLCIMMDSFQVRKQVRSQKIEEISFIPSVPGKFRFYCPVNGMEGTLIVKELSSGASSGEAKAEASRDEEAPKDRAPASEGGQRTARVTED